MGKNLEVASCRIESCLGLGKMLKNGNRFFFDGYCQKHYGMKLAGKDLNYEKPKITCCSISNCDGRGRIDNEGRESFPKNLCVSHYIALKNHGDVLYKYERVTSCSIEGCKNRGSIDKNGTEIFRLGFCSVHYSRTNKHGDPLFLKNVIGEDRVKNPLYSCYIGIKERCYNDKNKRYKDYGGRGIKMSDEWFKIDGFLQFCKDMGERPSNNHTIDRIDNDKGYSKKNCKWSTKHQQSANRRTNNETVGVSLDKKNGKWQAELNVGGKRVFRKNFANYDDAVKARKEAEIAHGIIY